MRKFRLSRRAVLRGAGGIAIALPWLEIMEPERSARAQAGSPAKRFLAVYTPGGNVIDDGPPSEWAPNASHRNRWAPTGTQDAPVLSPILAPLEPVKSKLLPLGGLSMDCAVGEQHQCGIIGWLTGTQHKVEEHLTKIREMEQSLIALGNAGDGCMAPQRIDTSDYQPTIGSAMNASTDAAIPKVGRLMMDMMVMALACDITAVGTLQWTDTEAKHTFPWLGLTEHHHFYQHDGGFRPLECERICTWYSEQHAYLLQQMDRIDMGGHSLLDESVVFFGSELGDPPSHGKGNMPFMLAGSGGGLRGGRYLKYNGEPHNNLLVSILNLFGDPSVTFGDPRHCTGALANLT